MHMIGLLGGIMGARTEYARDYASRLVIVNV